MWSLPLVMLAVVLARYWLLMPALLLWLGLLRRSGWGMAAPMLLSAALLGLHAQYSVKSAREARLPEVLEGETLTLVGTVADLPWLTALAESGQQRARFLFDTRVDDPCWSGQHRLELVWFTDDASGLEAGARVQVEVRLRRPRGLVNEAGFDSERQAMAAGVHARGTVRALVPLTSGQGVLHWRDQLSRRLQDGFSRNSLAAALVPALVTGDRRALDAGHWHLLRATGTAHLVAISGLHISLVAGLVWWLASRLLGLALAWSSGCYPASLLAVGPALLAATGYAALAGFSLPTIRALVMTTVVMLCLCGRWRLVPGTVLWLALMAVTVPAPLAWLDTSLWLSYGAVAVLMVLHGAGLTGMVRLQLALTLVFGVLTGALFGIWSLSALPANLVLVPVFSLLLVPLSLLQAGVDHLFLGAIIERLMLLCGLWLEWLVEMPPLPLPASMAALILTALVLLRLLLPALPGPRLVWIVALLPLLWPAAPRLPHGDAELRVFDVGQGQMLLVTTRHHRLLYDLGPAWQDGDSVDRLLLPWWRRQSPPALVFVSHQHLDHAGGAASLPAHWRQSLFAGEPEFLPGSLPCLRGQSWWFDGVVVEVLWPAPALPLRHSNNRSCVVRVRARNQTILLTGDIGRDVEYWLVQEEQDLRADVLQVPHHGSRSSSSFALLRAVMPRHAFVSAGYRNSFGHPAADIVTRYREAGIELYSTAASGMLVYRGRDQAPLRWRQHSAFPWRLPEPVVE